MFDSGKNQVNQQDELVTNLKEFCFITNQSVDGLVIAC